MSMSRVLLVGAALTLASMTASATLITSEADAALSGSTLIDFQSVAAGEYASLVLPGVTIQGIGSTMTVCTDCGGGGGWFGDVGQSLQNTGGSPANFDLLFDDVVTAFGIRAGAANNAWTFTAFDASDTLIESQAINVPCCDGYYRGIAASGIKRVRIALAGDWVVFDDLRFTAGPAAVPEPASLGLATLTLGLCGYSRRRRRA